MLPEKGSSLEGIDFLEEGLRISAEAFEIMRKLRILKINGVQLDGCLTHLSNELRYVEWDGYPGEYLPHTFRPKENVQLHLPNSLIKGIGTNSKFLKKLKVLNLNFCKNLVKDPNFLELPLLEDLHLKGCGTLVEVKLDSMKLKVLDLGYCENLKQTPNLMGLPCLEKLNLAGCTSVVEVHPSIEFHKRLVHLDLRDCNNLKNLATRINLISLERLDLRGCSKLEKFLDLQGNVECLYTLFLSGTAIKELTPSVVKHLKGLTYLELVDCKMLENLPNSIGEMKSLRCLNLEGSGIKRLPSSIAQLTCLWNLGWANCNLDEEAIQNLPHSLIMLNLSQNNFASLPESFNHLTNLAFLSLDDCLSLQTLDSLPSSIGTLQAEGCVSLETYTITECLSFTQLTWNLSGCHKLAENEGNNKPNIYYSQTQLPENCTIVAPGSEIPSWFSHIYESKDMTNWVCLNMDYPNSLPYDICVAAVFQIEDYDKPFDLWIQINGSSVEYIIRSEQRDSFKTDHIVLMRKTYDQDKFLEVFGNCNSDGCSIKVEISGIYHAEILGSYHDGFPYVKRVKVKVKKWGIHPVMDDTRKNI